MKNLVLVMFVLVLAACSTSAPTVAPNAATEPGALQVIRLDGTIKSLSLNDLKAIPKIKITIEGIEQEGPALLEVLRVAGVTDFKRVTISGVGSVTLNKDQVDTQVMLDFNNRGAVKFAAVKVPKVNWPKDITEIQVE